MTANRLAVFVCVVLVIVLSSAEIRGAQGGAEPQDQVTLSPEELRRATTSAPSDTVVPLPVVDPKTSRDWPLQNFDLHNSRYSPLDQVNVSNVSSLSVSWIYQSQSLISSTPIVVNGLMYVTRMGNVVALDATTGEMVWSSSEGGSRRGATYGDGKIYVATDARVIALDAKTGALVTSFGDSGVSHALVDVLKAKFPEIEDVGDWGYVFNMPPQYHDGILIVGTAMSENHIPSGVVLALDGDTGRLLWEFLTVPQGPEDEGWDVAKDTWTGGVRHGGGIWGGTPAIDPETNTVHLTIGNPSPDHDGSARKGINLFTNSFVALDLRSGRLKWFFQQVHHDIWDYDAGQQPTLFTARVNGQDVRAIAAGNKNGLLFVLNRDTGEPINPIVETPVPTESDTPGEEAWPTQPIPHTASGEVMTPAASQIPLDISPRYETHPKMPFLAPPLKEGSIHAPRWGIGYGVNAFHPETGLLYVAGREHPIFMTVIPVGATLKPGQFSTAGRREFAGMREMGNMLAYDPATGELRWRMPIPGGPESGTLATGGNLVFTGDQRSVYAFNAQTGDLLWTFNPGGGSRAGQITYQVNGVQYISLSAGGVVLTFTLPGG